MLVEEQVSALLAICEEIAGKKLPDVRGKLKKSASRVPAIWELLVIEEAARNASKIDYEPGYGSSPDIRTNPGGRPLWLEATYLEPRFRKEQRHLELVTSWISDVFIQSNAPYEHILIRYEPQLRSKAGNVVSLPNASEKKSFKRHPDLLDFIELVKSGAKPGYSRRIGNFGIQLELKEQPSSPGTQIISGVIHESPSVVSEHGLYRKLKKKGQIQRVDDPKVICIGSDESPALSQVNNPFDSDHLLEDSVAKLFQEYTSISGVILVNIQPVIRPLQFEREYKANTSVILNPIAKYPLNLAEKEYLIKLNFNRWKYDGLRYDRSYQRAPSKRLSIGYRILGDNPIKIELPAHLIIEILSGEKKMEDHVPFKEGEPLFNILHSGKYTISNCEAKKGDPLKGVPDTVIFELTEVFQSVFG